MIQTELDWLQTKRIEVKRARFRFGDVVDTWDAAMYLRIIDEQARLIRRLKTQVEAKR